MGHQSQFHKLGETEMAKGIGNYGTIGFFSTQSRFDFNYIRKRNKKSMLIWQLFLFGEKKWLLNEIRKAEKYNASLSNTLMLVGNALDPELLESENIFEMDCFIAATEDEQTNIMSCLLAKDYGVKQVIVHISTTNYIKPIR